MLCRLIWQFGKLRYFSWDRDQVTTWKLPWSLFMLAGYWINYWWCLNSFQFLWIYHFSVTSIQAHHPEWIGYGRVHHTKYEYYSYVLPFEWNWIWMKWMNEETEWTYFLIFLGWHFIFPTAYFRSYIRFNFFSSLRFAIFDGTNGGIFEWVKNNANRQIYINWVELNINTISVMLFHECKQKQTQY